MSESPVSRRPGLHPARLLRLVEGSVRECDIDLAGASVLTEAATGAYVVTPIMAAMAGARRVHAVTRSTRFGSVDEVVEQTMDLATRAGVADRIVIGTGIEPDLVSSFDIVTNCGHLRPLDARFIASMRPGAVVPLMFESWEIDLGRDDVDVESMRRAGIRFAGTNERHPAVDVFSYLGPMAIKLLTDAAVAVRGSRVVVLCDNPFHDYIVDGLRLAGADVVASGALTASDLDGPVDAVLIALKPTGAPVLSTEDLRLIASAAPGAVVAQFWGDVARGACTDLGVPLAPATDVPPGHMGVLPSDLGPEPVVRLQAGGLKVASVLLRPRTSWTRAEAGFVDEY